MGKTTTAYCKMRKTLGQKPDLASPEQRNELLKFLNKWGCRIAEDDFDELTKQLQQWWAEDGCKLPDKNIRDLDDSEREQIERAYQGLLKHGAGRRFQDTAAAKTLHALRPDTLPMWDAQIKQWFTSRAGKKPIRISSVT